jgi:carboxypeptidase Q
MLTPFEHKLNILGLGGSVGTNGLTGQVIVVKTFDELDQRASEVNGKIVAYNFDYTSYSATSRYRSQGASRAAAYGAIAVLVIIFSIILCER